MGMYLSTTPRGQDLKSQGLKVNPVRGHPEDGDHHQKEEVPLQLIDQALENQKLEDLWLRTLKLKDQNLEFHGRKSFLMYQLNIQLTAVMNVISLEVTEGSKCISESTMVHPFVITKLNMAI